MKEIIQRSPIPLYGAGIVWLIYGLIFPLYRWWDFLLVIGLSVLSYCLLKRKFPGKKIVVEKEESPRSTGNDTADRILAEGSEYLNRLRSVNLAIDDPELTGKINRLEEIGGKIFAHIASNPDKAPQIRKFMNYYLPTTLKLLQSYDTLDQQDVGGENITSAMSRIENIMDTIVVAFEKQLDSLFMDEAIDISADVTVLEGMLAQEGLGKSNFTPSGK